MAKKNLVNWSDCMPLSAAIFNQHDDYFLDSIRDSIEVRTNSYNYGLLPARKNRDGENAIRISQHVTGHIEVRLKYCDAVTASGIRIQFDATETGSELVKNYSVESDTRKNITQWDIILSVDPFHRVGSGDPNPEEVPPRHPNALPSYRLFVMPKGEINISELGSHYLTIGRIRKDAERFMVDADFIPPCTTMKSHPELQEYHAKFGNMFRSLENYSKIIIAKIHNRDNRGELGVHISLICREMLRYLATLQFTYTNKGLYNAPIDVLDSVSSLAHIMYVSFSYLSGTQKEETQKYFYEWSDVTPGSFDEQLADTLEMLYEHTDIRASMVRAYSFMYTLTELWQRLSTLEYIGQHKENIVVSERTTGNNTTGQNKTWSIMD